MYIHTKRRIDGEIKGWGIFLITTANSRGFFFRERCPRFKSMIHAMTLQWSMIDHS